MMRTVLNFLCCGFGIDKIYGHDTARKVASQLPRKYERERITKARTEIKSLMWIDKIRISNSPICLFPCCVPNLPFLGLQRPYPGGKLPRCAAKGASPFPTNLDSTPYAAVENIKKSNTERPTDLCALLKDTHHFKKQGDVRMCANECSA